MPVRPAVLGGDSFATYTVSYEKGNLTAVGRAGSTVLATHVVKTSGPATSIKLTVDCPSPMTGTGEALLLDGQDTGLIRAAIVDAEGLLVRDASHNVTFAVVSGPGMVLGVHSGQPDSHEPTNGNVYHTAYNGLVRAVVRVNATSASALGDLEEVAVRQFIDLDSSITAVAGEAAAPIVLEASAPGLASATVTIATSVDPNDGVLETAGKYGSKPVFFD